LLRAKAITLCVLAPRQYYDRYNVGWLESEINWALRDTVTTPELCISFRFEHFDPGAEDVFSLLESRQPVCCRASALRATS
jgi:hypothetical protein